MRRHDISMKSSGYPKDISEICYRFQKALFWIAKLTVQYVFRLEIQSVLDFSGQCFGCLILDIVLDI